MAGVALSVALGFGVLSPAIPLFAKQFGVSATAAGAVVSAFALMRLLSGLGAGRLVDRIGERIGLAAGIGVVAVSSLLAGFAHSYSQLLILRGIGGIGSAVFGVAAIGLVLRVAARRIRGRAVGVYRTGFLIGGIVGPAVGSAVLGLSLRAPFFLYTATLVLAGTVALVFVSRPGATTETTAEIVAEEKPQAVTQPQDTPEHESPGVEPTLLTVVRTRQYQAALVGNFAEGLSVFGIRSAIVPLLFMEKLGVADAWVAVAFLVSSLVQTVLMVPAGRWADAIGRRPVMVIGSILAVIGLVLLGVDSALWLGLAAMAVFGAGAAFLGTVPGALVGDVAGKRSGTVVAVFNMSSDFGAVIGPVLAGVLVDKGSFGAAFGFGAVVVALAGVSALRMRETAALER